MRSIQRRLSLETLGKRELFAGDLLAVESERIPIFEIYTGSSNVFISGERNADGVVDVSDLNGRLDPELQSNGVES